MRSLTKTSALGMVWLIAQSGAGRLISFFAQLVLARLLRPADFGIIALANSLVAVIAVLNVFGIDEVVLSRSHKLRFWLAPAFWVSLAFSLIGAIGLVAISPIAAHLYRTSTIIGLLSILAISIPLGAVTAVPNACLRSAMRFKFIASYGTVEFFALQLAIVLLAWSGFGAYSFVIPVPAAALVKAIVFWRAAKPAVKWRIRRQQIRLLLRNGSVVFGQKLVTSLRENGDYMLLGLVASKTSVGLYFMAFKLAALPVYTLVNSMYGVLFPVFAQLRGEPKRQLSAAISASRLIASLVIPLSFLQAAVATPVIRLFFGTKWQGAGSMLSILSVGLCFDVVPCVAGSLMSASGRFVAQWKWSIGTIFIFFALIGSGCFFFGPIGVAFGVTTFFILTAPSYSYYAMHSFGASVRDIAGIYVPPILCASVAVGLGVLLSNFPAIHNRELAALAILCIFSLAAYAILVRLLSPVVARDAAQRISTLLSRAA